MKKSARLFFIFFISSLLVSCTSVRYEKVSSNEINAEKLAINTYFDKDDYIILGTAKGISEYVWWDSENNDFAGDSGKYGYIYEPKELHLGEGIFVGTGKKSPSSDDEYLALTRARLNANYLLIEEVYAMGGDFILEPVYSVEAITDINSYSEKRQFKVTVRAKVLQLKNK